MELDAASQADADEELNLELEGAGDQLGGDLGIDFDPDADVDDELDLGSDTDLTSDTEFDLGDLAEDPAAELVSEVATAEDDFDFEDEGDSANTKLDLARAYIDMGDEDGARDILKEVLDEGSAEQQEQAQALLEGL